MEDCCHKAWANLFVQSSSVHGKCKSHSQKHNKTMNGSPFGAKSQPGFPKYCFSINTKFLIHVWQNNN